MKRWRAFFKEMIYKNACSYDDFKTNTITYKVQIFYIKSNNIIHLYNKYKIIGNMGKR